METVSLPPFEEFDRIIVRHYPYDKPITTQIISSSTAEELHEFLESYQDEWHIPTYGEYEHGTRIELYAGDELVEYLYFGASIWGARTFFARNVGGIHVRTLEEEELNKLEKILGVGVRPIGHP